MVEQKLGYADPIKEAFAKVREDMELLKKELNNQKKDISNQKELLEAINKKLKVFSNEYQEIKDKLDFFNVSSGNSRVINDHQRSASMSINSKQSETMVNNASTPLDQTLTLRFKQLSDREFSVFLAIYEIEHELGSAAFTDLANKLTLSEPAIRNVVNRLLTKQMPVIKERFFNRKASLSIQKEFKDPKIIREILNARESKSKQTTLPS